MSLEASFNIGDLVEITESHGEAGKRGYILRRRKANADTSIFDVVLDEARTLPPPKDNMFSFQPPARVVKVPAQDLKPVRGHGEVQEMFMLEYMDKEYPCLGIAASSYKVSRINPDSPHGRIVRPAARDLPGIHSCDRTFVSAEMEELFQLVHRGDFFVQWSHAFIDEEIQEMDNLALARAAPYVVIGVYLEPTLDNPCFIFQASPSKEEYRSCVLTMALTESQNNSLAMRALHYFLRVAGCDVGLAGLFVMESFMADYIRKAWWKESLDAAIIMADIAVQVGASVEWLCCRANLLGEALAACKKHRQQAEMYELMRIDYAINHPSLEFRLLLFQQQATAYVFSGNFDEAEQTLFDGLRKLFSVYGVKCGLAKDLFAGIATTLLQSYACKMIDASSECGDGGASFQLVILATMFSVSNLYAGSHKVCISALKPELRKKNVARRVLLTALQTSSLEDFRENLISWGDDSQKLKFRQFAKKPMDGRQELKRLAKENARSFIRQDLHVNRGLCDNPGCTQEKVRMDKPSRCSRCKVAIYCSRNCQVAHWKVHKQSCSATTK